MRPPISDPFSPPITGPEIETRLFKYRFWRVYFGMIPMCSLIAVWFLTTSSIRSSPSSTFYLFFFVIVINPLISAISMMYRPVKVTREGVKGQSSIGFIEWERMRRVRFFWLGLPYARVSLHKMPIIALWIPLSMLDAKGFAQTIEEWAPEDNSLRLWLQKRKF